MKLPRPLAQSLLVAIFAVAIGIVFIMGRGAVETGGDGVAVFSGYFLGFMTALVWLAVAGGALVYLIVPRGPPVIPPPPKTSVLTRDLGPLLTELEAVRTETRRRIQSRLYWLVPLWAGVGVAVAVLIAPRHEPPATADMLQYALFGAAIGYGLAVWLPSRTYDRLFKARVLAALAARFGALTYRRPPRPDLARLRQFNLLPRFSSASAEDQIQGQYRGLAISVTQLRLVRGVIQRKLVFDGLLAEVTLKNRLLGITAIAEDAGALGNLIEATQAKGFRRVGLEDLAFERDYEVWSTDQVMARALITPTFMERFRALDQRPGFGRILALAQDDVLLLAMPRVGSSLFQPPGFRTPAADADALKQLFEDIEAVLHATDSVIDLDDATRLAADKVASDGRTTHRQAPHRR